MNMSKLWKLLNGNSNEKRSNTAATPYVPWSDALLFSSISNNYGSMNISAVYRAVELISDSIAQLPIKVKENNDELDSHPINFIFDTNVLSKYNLMKLLIQSVLLKGNGFAYIERGADGTAIGLRFLESGDVQIHYEKEKQKLYYTCNYIPKKIEPCNMIHLLKNTYDGVNGLSVISYASRAIKISNNTENSASNFFTKGCNLAGVLSVDGSVTDKQRNDIRKNWNQAYSDGGNGLAILQGNMKYSPIQLNAADSQLIESRLFNVTDIARFFGINPVLLGDLSHSSYSTLEAAQQEFLLHTLNPYVVMVEQEFTRKLFKPSENNLQINLDEAALLKTDKAAQADYYTKLLNAGVLTPNEVRNELGYSSVSGLDKHIIAYTKIEDNQINNTKE